MKTVAQIIEELRGIPECRVLPPAGVPEPSHGFGLPEGVQEFYAGCGGIDLFPHEDWGWRLVGPKEFLRADRVILGLSYKDHPEDYDGTASEGLYVIAVRGDGPDHISIDTHPSRLGRCFDSFSGDHATESSRVIALSFAEMLNKLVAWRREGYFWEDEFYGYFGQADHLLKLQGRKQKGANLP